MTMIGSIAQAFARATAYVLALATLAAVLFASATVAQASPASSASTTAVELVAYSETAPARRYRPREGSAHWSCARHGNHVCGPRSGAPAGCYRHGRLVIPWTRYDRPWLDPLWARFTPPC